MSFAQWWVLDLISEPLLVLTKKLHPTRVSISDVSHLHFITPSLSGRELPSGRRQIVLAPLDGVPHVA